MSAVLAESVASVFPRAKIEQCIRAELARAAEDQAALHDQSDSDAVGNSDLFANLQIDSLIVVGVLCAIDEVVSFPIPESVVRAGGYDSVVQVVEDLIPKIEKKWENEIKKINKKNGIC